MRMSSFCPADRDSSFDRHTGLLHARLRECDRALKFGNREQVVDDFNQAIVEIFRRAAEVFVRFLKQRVIAGVGGDQDLGIGCSDELHQRFVAPVVGRI